jgi:tetratricopeptide (TPR) repeat protein
VSEKYKVATLGEMEIPPLEGRPTWSRVRQYLGIGAFGINAWTAQDPGIEVIEEHDEVGESAGKHEEVYLVLSGRATFTVDGDDIPAAPGTFVFVGDPTIRRKAVAEEPGTTVVAIGAQQGVAFQPSEWERSAPAFGYFATGEYDKARDVLAELLEEHPENGGILYNLACAESQLGHSDDAIVHLERAVEQENRFKDAARRDSDFDPIRDDSRFQELVGA